MQYVKQLILAEGSLEQSSQSNTINESLRSLVKQVKLGAPTSDDQIDPFSKCFDLPDDFFAYIRSNSLIDTDYKSKDKYLEWQHTGNKFIKYEDIIKVIDSFYDKNKIIRNPIVTIENNTIKLIHDNYTHLDGIILTYYKLPNRFNVLKYNNSDVNATHNYCSLPFSCFDELV